MEASSALNSLPLMIRSSPSLPVSGGYLSHGRFITSFLETLDGQTVFVIQAVSYITFIKNNPYTIVAYFGASCPGLPHFLANFLFSTSLYLQ